MLTDTSKNPNENNSNILKDNNKKVRFLPENVDKIKTEYRDKYKEMSRLKQYPKNLDLIDAIYEVYMENTENYKILKQEKDLYKTIKEAVDQQNEKEINLINEFHKISHLRLEELNKEISEKSTGKILSLEKYVTVDKVELSKYINRYFYSYKLQDSISDLLQIILNADGKNSDGSITEKERDRINQYIKDLKRIGEKTVNGLVLSGKLSDEDIKKDKNFSKLILDTLAMKVGINPRGDKEICHEAVVGLYAINNLREKIPNFTMTRGVIDCTFPAIGLNNEVVSVCPGYNTKSSTIPYLINELVANSTNFSNFLKSNKCTKDHVLNFLAQITLSIRYAHKEYKFTHYDLHTENILINENELYSGGCYIRYPYEQNKDILVLSPDGQIATIIDFGYSYFELNGESYGNIHPGFNMYQIYNDRSFPISDIYKVLFFSLSYLLRYNIKVFDQVYRIANYFYPSFSKLEIMQVVFEQIKEYYSLPYEEFIYEQFNTDDFTIYLLDFIKKEADDAGLIIIDDGTIDISTIKDYILPVDEDIPLDLNFPTYFELYTLDPNNDIIFDKIMMFFEECNKFEKENIHEKKVKFESIPPYKYFAYDYDKITDNIMEQNQNELQNVFERNKIISDLYLHIKCNFYLFNKIKNEYNGEGEIPYNIKYKLEKVKTNIDDCMEFLSKKMRTVKSALYTVEKDIKLISKDIKRIEEGKNININSKNIDKYLSYLIGAKEAFKDVESIKLSDYSVNI